MDQIYLNRSLVGYCLGISSSWKDAMEEGDHFYIGFPFNGHAGSTYSVQAWPHDE